MAMPQVGNIDCWLWHSVGKNKWLYNPMGM